MKTKKYKIIKMGWNLVGAIFMSVCTFLVLALIKLIFFYEAEITYLYEILGIFLLLYFVILMTINKGKDR